MSKNLEIILSFRKKLLAKTEALSAEQLNKIPEGFGNNIIWNLAHMDAVLQALCYRNSGLPFTVDEKYVLPFLPGTKPGDFIPAAEIEIIKAQFISNVEQVNADLDKGVFKIYQKVERIEKVYNIRVETIYDALSYATHHEGIHLHAVSSLMKQINK